MQKQSSNRTNETETATLPPRPSAPVLQLAQARSRCRLHIVLPPMPARELCLADRKLRAAARAIELALWHASGGDFLRSSLAAEFIRLAQRS